MNINCMTDMNGKLNQKQQRDLTQFFLSIISNVFRHQFVTSSNAHYMDKNLSKMLFWSTNM